MFQEKKKRCDTAVFESVAHPQGITVWVGLSANGPTKPVAIDPKAKICSSDYVNKVLKPFLKNARRLYPSNDYIFHQDSAPAHRVKATLLFLREQNKYVTRKYNNAGEIDIGCRPSENPSPTALLIIACS
ncbi:hypothetical protein ILUMI_26869 [Ignelater luminosus]|uniref:Transposase n=1 Tax=Ignelater luminosus TaxID=2038154 RepID=A0A8K0FYR3_IGNLU|nr:hypothetical protein ILUMI_26869 [Ignelater luminosus]